MESQNISDTLNLIVTLQKNTCCNDNSCPEGCTRPFLGPVINQICYNTRPITLFACCTGTNWEFPYEINGTTGTSSVFRVEQVDGCCCTCRVLAPNPDTTAVTQPYVATESFVTINLSCCGALTCLPDTFIACS